jgi:hypothetical protein
MFGLLGWPAVLLLAVAAVVAAVVYVVQKGVLAQMIGPTAWIVLSVLGILAQAAFAAFRQVRGLFDPKVLSGPAPGGMVGGAPRRDWQGGADPLERSNSGYLYLLQHDVRDMVRLAQQNGSKVVVFIDDLDTLQSADRGGDRGGDQPLPQPGLRPMHVRHRPRPVDGGGPAGQPLRAARAARGR